MAAINKKDCQYAVTLLKDYYGKLDETCDKDLRNALEKVMKVFQSPLFGALIDIQEYYEEILRDVHKSPEQVSKEAVILAKKWERPVTNTGNDVTNDITS